jgi:dTDP-4-amino-4,6-dideoxygalactose transaminase
MSSVEQSATLRLRVARPLLPTLDRIAPLLAEIDRNRWYSNFGPLAERFAGALGAHFGTPDGAEPALVANATVGLSLCLSAVARPGARFCLVPAWTFVATAHAVRGAGLEPFFVDVDPHRWALTPTLARAALARAPGPVAAAMPVAPFGAPLDGLAWDAFEAETGVPVVIDAAAAFDTLRPVRAPAVLSLQATKALGVGEGGAVLSTDADLLRRLRQASNFGFYGRREAEIPGTNAKMSEYHAAVGLAALEDWPATRVRLVAVADAYARALADVPGVAIQPGFGTGWVSMTCIAVLDRTPQEIVAAALDRLGIETRSWWGRGPWAQPAFAAAPCLGVGTTERLAARTLGIPFAVDLTLDEVERVGAALEVTLAASAAFARTSLASGR